MPRLGRIDIAGQLCHVIARGNERKGIFIGKEGCEDSASSLKMDLGMTGNNPRKAGRFIVAG